MPMPNKDCKACAGKGCKYCALTKKAAEGSDTRTFPISRLLTSPAVAGVLSGAQGAMVGHGLGKGWKGTVGGGLLGAGAGALGSALHRVMSARATRGRARTGNTGLGGSEKQVLESIRSSEKKSSDEAVINRANEILDAASARLEEAEKVSHDVDSEALRLLEANGYDVEQIVELLS